MGDLIPDVAAERAFETVLDALERHDVRELTERLGDRERIVIRAHYGIGVPRQTLHQIGNRLGVTAERARQNSVGHSAIDHDARWCGLRPCSWIASRWSGLAYPLLRAQL